MVKIIRRFPRENESDHHDADATEFFRIGDPLHYNHHISDDIFSILRRRTDGSTVALFGLEGLGQH